MKTQIYQTTNEKMEKTISVLKEDLNTIRTGRANPKMLDKVTVDYYGTVTPVKQIAAISSPDPRTLQIQPWDKSSLHLIEKAIQVADLGVNPTNDGLIIRISIPQLTEERRKELVKQAQKMGEQAKVAIRNLRRDANDLIKKGEKDGSIAEDEAKKELDDDVQDACDDLTSKGFFVQIRRLQPQKDKDILNDEIVVKLVEDGNTITLITSMFKKYI